MALARIITGSPAYSRELTPYLFARGYAVEVVSPDKIPDTVADLEIRVDAGPGDQLSASVVIRRSPEPREATRIPEEPVSFHAEPAENAAARAKGGVAANTVTDLSRLNN